MPAARGATRKTAPGQDLREVRTFRLPVVLAQDEPTIRHLVVSAQGGEKVETIAICRQPAYNVCHRIGAKPRLGVVRSFLAAARHEPSTFSNAAPRLAAANDALAGATLAAADQSRPAARAADRLARYSRHRARAARLARWRRRAHNAEPFVSLRLVRADRGGPSRRHAV